MMIYEVRAKKFMQPGSSSVVGSNCIGQFYKSRDKAESYAKKLNQYLNVYYVKEIKLQDG